MLDSVLAAAFGAEDMIASFVIATSRAPRGGYGKGVSFSAVPCLLGDAGMTAHDTHSHTALYAGKSI